MNDDILIKPPQLRQTARSLNDSARKIRATLDAVDQVIRGLGPTRFEGQRAADMRARYQKIHGNLVNAPDRVLQMARQLETLAAGFEEADRRLTSGRSGSCIGNLIDDIWLKIMPWFSTLRWSLPQIKWPFDGIRFPDTDLIQTPAVPSWLADNEHTPIPPRNDAGGQSTTPGSDDGVQSVAHDPFPANLENVERSRQAIDALNVEDNFRYQRNRRGENETYCNIFVMDYAKKMDAPLPEFLDWNKDGRIDRYLNANQAVAWLRGTFNEGGGAVQQGPALGWKTVDANSAAELSAKGYVVVAGWENQGGIGHMAVVRPESTPGNIRIAQAGARNFENGTIQDGFGSGKNIEYFVYLTPTTING